MPRDNKPSQRRRADHDPASGVSPLPPAPAAKSINEARKTRAERARRYNVHPSAIYPLAGGKAVAQYPRGVDRGSRYERRFRAAWVARVHQLRGDRAGTWSISVSGNWRLTFDIRQGEICNFDLEDYH